MAIDTAEKRRSVAGIAGVGFIVSVTPNASKDVEWRQQAGWSYSGIVATTAYDPGTPTFSQGETVPYVRVCESQVVSAVRVSEGQVTPAVKFSEGGIV